MMCAKQYFRKTEVEAALRIIWKEGDQRGAASQEMVWTGLINTSEGL